MSFNPILFANEVNKQFIRYQLTAFPLSDPNISEQVKKILSPGMLERSPLFKGPYLSLKPDRVSSCNESEKRYIRSLSSTSQIMQEISKGAACRC